MPVASGVNGLGLIALVAILLAGIAVTATVRTGVGCALAMLLVLVAVAYVAGIIWNAQLVANPAAYLASHPYGGLGPAIAIAVDLGLFGIVGVSALVTAAVARHWTWVAGIVAAVLPMVALALSGMLPTDPFSYARNLIPFSAALFCPVLVGWTYAMSRRRPRPLAESSSS